MSAQQQIRKLESLLERIQANRHELTRPAVVALVGPSTAEPADTPSEAPVEQPQEPPKPAAATPMEQAIQTSAAREPSAPEIEADEPDDDEPVLTIEAPSGELDAVAISDSTPTAPVHTRAPDVVEPAAPEAPPASQPQRMTTATPQPSAPIARVVSRAVPQTFGELIDRALSLRPR